jgi:hypothetical protein
MIERATKRVRPNRWSATEIKDTQTVRCLPWDVVLDLLFPSFGLQLVVSFVDVSAVSFGNNVHKP